MIEIRYKASFVKQLNALEIALQEEVFEKIELFKDKNNHQTLKVHKLHGKLKNLHSFSVNYSYRIVFEYDGQKNAIFLDIGNHDLYK
ncbi:MAG: type II toxin-antitoxin system RelE/ParE family toxin [Candidatus Paceibacterota bacterium]